MLFDQRVEDLLTVGEEAVERGRGDAGALGDGTGGDGVDAALLDEGGRGVEDPLDGLAAAGPGPAACGGDQARPGPARRRAVPRDLCSRPLLPRRNYNMICVSFQPSLHAGTSSRPQHGGLGRALLNDAANRAAADNLPRR